MSLKQLFSTRNVAWVPFSFNTIKASDSKIILHFLSWKLNVFGEQWWFLVLMWFCLEMRSWDIFCSTHPPTPGTEQWISDRQQPDYCDLQVGNYFLGLLKNSFVLLPPQGYVWGPGCVLQNHPNNLPQDSWSWMSRGEREWPTLTDSGAGNNFTASKWLFFHVFLSL